MSVDLCRTKLQFFEMHDMARMSNMALPGQHQASQCGTGTQEPAHLCPSCALPARYQWSHLHELPLPPQNRLSPSPAHPGLLSTPCKQKNCSRHDACKPRRKEHSQYHAVQSGEMCSVPPSRLLKLERGGMGISQMFIHIP